MNLVLVPLKALGSEDEQMIVLLFPSRHRMRLYANSI